MGMLQFAKAGFCWLGLLSGKFALCDAIWRDQSELAHVTFSVFYLIEVLTWRSTFC